MVQLQLDIMHIYSTLVARILYNFLRMYELASKMLLIRTWRVRDKTACSTTVVSHNALGTHVRLSEPSRHHYITHDDVPPSCSPFGDRCSGLFAQRTNSFPQDVDSNCCGSYAGRRDHPGPHHPPRQLCSRPDKGYSVGNLRGNFTSRRGT